MRYQINYFMLVKMCHLLKCALGHQISVEKWGNKHAMFLPILNPYGIDSIPKVVADDIEFE